jgi:hypothetical protein
MFSFVVRSAECRKYLLIILLLVAVVITAGCVGGNKETVVTPTPQIIYVTVIVTPTPTPTVVVQKDPFIGTWILTTLNGQQHPHIIFENGQVNWGVYNDGTDMVGTWVKVSPNKYRVTTSRTGMEYDYDYDPVNDTIGEPFYAPYIIEYRQGKEPTPTYSTPPSSSGLTHFSGSGDDVRSFTVTGSGLRIFTMSHTGSHNFAVVLKDNGGNYVTLLANEIGSYSGKKSERLTSGTYYLDITADGSWTIDISSM